MRSIPAGRQAVTAGTVMLARLEVYRVAKLLDGPPPTDDVDPGRARRYLLVRLVPGGLGGTLLALVLFGLTIAAAMLWSWTTATPMIFDPSFVVTNVVLGYWLVPGLLLFYLALAGLWGVVRWERALADRLVSPTREEQLTRQVAALSESRAAIVAAVDDERRRIERDLHDGVQQRLVALGMLLGRARRHPDRLDLVAQAHEHAQRALVELREVSWRVYPAALDTAGLAAALESVAERAPLPVQIDCALDAEPPADVRAVAWFVVCEAVTNAAKHSGAAQVRVTVARSRSTLTAMITDDGRGGADPGGGGLAGLARRVAAADGRLSVTSPPGGPTTVRAELPCG
jgi:signal transduction histidine kinase